MALVFKIKSKDTLRRWLVSDDFSAMTFSLTIKELEDKIRALFHFPRTASLVLTYIDKDSDVVTLGDDQDLLDACLIQKLNPLHVEVYEKASLPEQANEPFKNHTDDGNTETVSYPYTSTVKRLNATQSSCKNIDSMYHARGDCNHGVRGVLSHHVSVLPKHKTDNVSHRGGQCDGCVMDPTEGPRYRSNSGQALECLSSNGYDEGLDARFMEDVTVVDGTELEPDTRFTKTWRMRNNGSLAWPQGTQLVYVGGSTLSSRDTVKLELPEGGLPCGQDVEVSVGLAAPNVVGRYVSHWRLLSPSGQMFGHTVWVAIQVRSQLLKISNCQNVSHSEKMEDASASQGTFSSTGIPETDALSSAFVTEMARKNTGENSSVLSLDDAQKSRVLVMETDSERDGFSIVEKPVTTDLVETEKGVAETDNETQLKLLETMGFGDRGSNVFWLHKNKENLQSTLKDLLICAGWEETIRNLEELGFNDQMTNIRLLHKHKGSLKLVVTELVKIENHTNKQ